FAHPLGVARFSAEPHETRFPAWKDALSRLAERPNLHAKLGGLAMPDNGFSWHLGERPPTSDEFAEQQSPWIEHAISVFGLERCMFESNFPVDRYSVSYRVLWNAYKKIAAQHGSSRDALLKGTAERVYSI
ncbi:MAG: amidohydrolase family protein, partial [Pseudomonadota bacterium]